MDISFNISIPNKYKNQSQIARILTETWTSEESYCPNCGYSHLDKMKANTPVTDFVCNYCKENYELKSQKNSFGNKINDGAYNTMIAKLREGNVPNLFLLNYDSKLREVVNFMAIPKQFFTPSLIEKRKPLSERAERHGWVGCNILIGNIPSSGRVFLIKEGSVIKKSVVLTEWKRVSFLKEVDFSRKGWLLDIMTCIDKLGKQTFILEDMYEFEGFLSKKHPRNKHIKDKIRQQLQILRDKGYLRFIGRGKYLINHNIV